MPKLKFYDVKRKTSFTTDKYIKVTKGKTLMAKAKHKASDNYYCWRILGRKK